MDNALDFFLFQIYPYIAIAVFILGSILRFDRDPYSWRTKSSQLLRRKQLILGSILFHLGILTVLAGHFVGPAAARLLICKQFVPPDAVHHRRRGGRPASHRSGLSGGP